MGLSQSRNLYHSGRWIVPSLLLAVAAATAFGGDEYRELLRFDRVWIAQGESWRLLTGHVAHLGWPHLSVNAAGLILVWFLVGDRFTVSEWWLVVGVAVFMINLGLWFLSPALIWYVGLSGLLHGLLAAGIVVRLRQFDGETLLLAALLIGKLAWEQFGGPLPGSEATSGGNVVVDAHLYGALGGAIGAMPARIRVKRRRSI